MPAATLFLTNKEQMQSTKPYTFSLFLIWGLLKIFSYSNEHCHEYFRYKHMTCKQNASAKQIDLKNIPLNYDIAYLGDFWHNFIFLISLTEDIRILTPKR